MDGTPQRLKGSDLINNRKMDRLRGGPTTGGGNNTRTTAAIRTQQQQYNQTLPSKPTTKNDNNQPVADGYSVAASSSDRSTLQFMDPFQYMTGS